MLSKSIHRHTSTSWSSYRQLKFSVAAHGIYFPKSLSLPRADYSQSARSLSLPVDIKPVPLPSLSPTMSHGSISQWKKAVGDTLSPGDVLCDIDTDKASVALEVQDDGILARILVAAQGSELPVGSPIALIVDSMESFKVFQQLNDDEYRHLMVLSPAVPSSPASSSPSSPPSPDVIPSLGLKKQLSPAARHIVKSKDLDISSLTSTGGRAGHIITKSDVLMGLSSGKLKGTSSMKSAPTPAAITVSPPVPVAPPTRAPVTAPTPMPTDPVNSRFTDIPNSNMRKVIAKRLTESKATVPHLYLSMEVNIDEVLTLRKYLKKALDVNVSVNDLVIKSAAMALRDVPQAHAKWNKQTDAIVSGDNIDISVAVATPTGESRAGPGLLSHMSCQVLTHMHVRIDYADRHKGRQARPGQHQLHRQGPGDSGQRRQTEA